jgi:hypothetical protein
LNPGRISTSHLQKNKPKIVLDSRIYCTPHTAAAYHGSSGVSAIFGIIFGLFNDGVIA